jgi:pectinesterase
MGTQLRNVRGDITVRNVTVRQTGAPVNMFTSAGSATIDIKNSVFRASTNGNPTVNAEDSESDWTITNTEIYATPSTTAVKAWLNAGDWSVEDSTIETADIGVDSLSTSPPGNVINTTFTNVSTNCRGDVNC